MKLSLKLSPGWVSMSEDNNNIPKKHKNTSLIWGFTSLMWGSGQKTIFHKDK